MAGEHYRRPGWFTRNVFNPRVAVATRAGLSIWGSRILQVRGRTSGQVRETPVNLLTFDGQRYLVAPRGVTEWVRNLRRWKMEVGVFFDGVSGSSPDDELRRIAPDHPIFRLTGR